MSARYEITDLVDVTRKISEEGIKVNDGRRPDE